MTRKMECGGTEITTKKIPAIGAHVTEVVVHVNSLDKEKKGRDSDEGQKSQQRRSPPSAHT